MDLENVEATINLSDYSEEDLQQLINGMINDHPMLENILTNIKKAKSVVEDHPYHQVPKSEENVEDQCIISKSEQEIRSTSPVVSSIPDKINLEYLISKVLNDSADPSAFLLKKIKGNFLENHKMD